ncbi:hypothetical protein HY310_02880 [Candidatus Microgenomates bacterium]|nr:hypothetical protein [Candidatus Microgenomates bacterium]
MNNILLKTRCTKGSLVIYEDKVAIELSMLGSHKTNSMPYSRITGVEVNMKSTRLIFNDDFYRLSAVLLSNKFLKLKDEILKRYANMGLPVPSSGFSKLEEYIVWLKKAIKLKNTFDLPGAVVEDVLRKFNLNPKDENNRNGLTAKLFFNKELWQESPYSKNPINLVIRGRGESRELWVKIEPWTKKTDYVRLWGSIQSTQRTLTGYRGKEKFQPTFKRDFEVYQLYLEVKNVGGKQVLRSMSSHPDYYTLADQFVEGDIDGQLRSIKSRFNKLLAGIDIL